MNFLRFGDSITYRIHIFIAKIYGLGRDYYNEEKSTECMCFDKIEKLFMKMYDADEHLQNALFTIKGKKCLVIPENDFAQLKLKTMNNNIKNSDAIQMEKS